MRLLSTKDLLIAFCDAYTLQLDEAFIEMLTSEIMRRGITPPQTRTECYEQIANFT
ncbi:sporulation histidine kinase inhibitor Sda [Guptibacillus hwajinpoensis]|uniref:sporulation histidine kinase inhibitor Sda n=1 Tax=Guptibacillus hwajinpoensis TaxID=208199 RepID=UPI0018841558|nr:sporulation histidine kinase inhibitor Sda [Pseudalkalibacillus hwajinpoensis]MBF0707608.1 sporulation histidine kinase inhibitor Sda [Pseudalkalibacillus hwajinpoensis]WLR58998.1 sporulation histidine kinase inhibitor Sda [Pseudalkalibacillus hwajinpoensis]